MGGVRNRAHVETALRQREQAVDPPPRCWLCRRAQVSTTGRMEKLSCSPPMRWSSFFDLRATVSAQAFPTSADKNEHLVRRLVLPGLGDLLRAVA
jgi:hypothetical protein